MSTYRRWYVPGGTYFFTVVTHRRRPILASELGRTCLRLAIEAERAIRPFEMPAIVLLPDHLHTIWSLPDQDQDFSLRWRKIKERFTTAFLSGGGQEAERSPSRRQRGERGVWQRRFWEHVVRDDDDFKRCLDYIHCNPVKHGLAERASAYPFSSFGRWVELGEYDSLWGTGEVVDIPGAEWE